MDHDSLLHHYYENHFVTTYVLLSITRSLRVHYYTITTYYIILLSLLRITTESLLAITTLGVPITAH